MIVVMKVAGPISEMTDFICIGKSVGLKIVIQDLPLL
jgi:hypothetical protein